MDSTGFASLELLTLFEFCAVFLCCNNPFCWYECGVSAARRRRHWVGQSRRASPCGLNSTLMLECKSISAARLRHQRVKDHRRDLRGTRLSSGRAVKEGERRHTTALLTTQKSGARLGTMQPFQILVKGSLKTRCRVFLSLMRSVDTGMKTILPWMEQDKVTSGRRSL